MTTPDAITVTLLIAGILERLGVPYVVGGSMASAAYGPPRSTMNVDILAALRMDQVEPLLEALADKFYVDEGSIREAIKGRSRFNLVHFETTFKVDIFLPRGRAFDTAQLQRRTAQPLSDTSPDVVYLATAEDTILAKLNWYRRGGEVSDRQWQDILGVLATQQGQLDLDYLHHWAGELGVGDLLQRALQATKGPHDE